MLKRTSNLVQEQRAATQQVLRRTLERPRDNLHESQDSTSAWLMKRTQNQLFEQSIDLRLKIFLGSIDRFEFNQ